MSAGAGDAGRVGVVPAHAWYARSTLAVAVDLLGARITTRSPEGDVTVSITEVEAYGGVDDPGSHAYRGRSARNDAMFAEPGRLYMYRHLGLHFCVNIVTLPAGQPSAVLLRAGEVVDGAELAWERRARVGVVDSDRQIARGPARLAVALGLDLSANRADVTEAGGAVVVHVRDNATRPSLASGPRVGVGGEGADGARFPWRLWLVGEPTVSPFRRAYRSPSPRNGPASGTAGQ
ncbi:MAG: DNA-3-methyladenine glycosylase [Cellulomonas sp.]